MEQLRKIKNNFMDTISNGFPLSSAKKIMSKGTLALLAVSISSGAMAHSLQEEPTLNHLSNTASIELMNDNFHDCQDHDVKLKEINDIVNKNKIGKNFDGQYPVGEDSGIQVKNPEHLLELTPENFKEIIKNGISGVYKHPFVEGEVSTLIFDNDKRDDPFKIITEQLIDLGLDREGFAAEYRGLVLSDTIKKNVFGQQARSSHIQLNHEHYDDTNASNIYTGNPETFDDSSYTNILSTILHEAAHSLKHQQNTAYDRVFNNFERGVKSETSSFTAEGLASFKFMKKAEELGQSDEIVETFLNNYGYEGMQGQEILKIKGSSDTHLHSPASAFVMKMINENPEIVMGMSNKDIVTIADIVSDESLEYNFKDDFETTLATTANQAYDMMQGIHQQNEDNPKSVERYKKLLNQKYENVMDKEHFSPSDLGVVKAKEAFDYFEEGSHNLSLSDFTEKYTNDKMEEYLDGESQLRLIDRDINHLIADVPLDNFINKVENNEKISSIIDRISNEIKEKNEINTPEIKMESIDDMENNLLSSLKEDNSYSSSKMEKDNSNKTVMKMKI